MASQLPSKILIIGSTGVIGKYITAAILSAKGASIPSLSSVSILTSASTVSNPDKESLLSTWKSKGLSVITGDIHNADDVGKAYTGIDTVVSCLGRGGLLEQIDLLKWAEESDSVKWFFPSEYGTDIEYDESSNDEKPHQNKLKVRKYIRENLKKVKVTYVVTGPYLEMYLFKKPGLDVAGGFDAGKKDAVLVGDGEGKIGVTTMPDVGKLVAAALAHPEASQDKILKVQSFVTTPKEILAEFQKQTGVQFKVDYTPIDKLEEAEQKLWAEGNPAAALLTLRRIWASGKTLYEKTDNEVIGLKPEDMETLDFVVKKAINGEGW
ncbi:NmrA-like family protein [Pseudomassariella vexata]|uniref:NmrA-like family protein n=1 Tax=Pseudomassariella vexata TaxID=1141098 RepID=A0A1Y2EBJ9_9PEZI|nr:NmrA-like family protein [Pseudomassariella vexata]ORY68949.1 NmrA-like family protein [Pseudomassariella vexata]